MHPQVLLTGQDVAEVGEDGSERRSGQRLRTVYRVARVISRGDQGLARVHNISDLGMMLSVSVDLCIGDSITIDLSERHSLVATVIWHIAGRCGLKFKSPIDSAAVLKSLYEERSHGNVRPLRLPHSKAIIVSSELGIQMVRLQDVSQAGLKVAHDGRFTPGLPVKARLAPDIECRGVVRWSRDGAAGIALTDLLSVDQLGSVNAI